MPEEWKEVKDWPQYAISSLGRVKRIKPISGGTVGSILKPYSNHPSNYLEVKLRNRIRKQHKRIHRLVAIAFLGNPPTPKHQVNHKNGNKLDNRPENLEWVTHKENGIHAYRTGLTPKPPTLRGEFHKRCTLTIEIAQYILDAPRDRGTGVALAKKFGISEGTVGNIRNRWTFKYLTPTTPSA